MDDHGLFPVDKSGVKSGVSVLYPSTERQVFEWLRLVYKEPTDRNYFDDVIPLDSSVDWDPVMTKNELNNDLAAHSNTKWVD